MDSKSLSSEGSEPPASFSPNAVHLLRTVQNNTLLLSQMADNKASILMGATFVVFSIAVSQSLSGDLPWSLAVLAVFAFASSLFAVLAVLPQIGKPKGAVAPNPLFFGHFTGLEEEQWAQDILSRLEQDETIYRAMLHDIYQNGEVLQHRKYHFLTLAYRIFASGLLATLAVYAIEFATGI